MCELKECTVETFIKKDRVFVSIGLTKNIGNYQSVKIDAGLSSDLLEGETVEQGQERVESKVLSYLRNNAKTVIEESKQIIQGG